MEMLKLAINLLKRWNNVKIPDDVWSNNGEDYLLPLETQEFLELIR